MKKTIILLLFLSSVLCLWSQRISYGVINTKGEEIIPFEYGFIYPQEYNYMMYPARDTIGRYGAINFKGQVVIPFEYSSKPFFYNNYILAEKKGIWGALDKQGKELLPFHYYHLMALTDNLLAVMHTEEDNLYGIIDTEGNNIVKPKYENIWPLNDTLLTVRKEGKEGLININGKEVIPCEYFWLSDKFPGYILSYSFANKHMDRYSLYDTKGNKRTAAAYSEILYVDDSTAIVKTNNNEYSLIYLDGKDSKIRNLEYSKIEYIGNNLFAVQKRYYWAFADMDFNELTPNEYASISLYYDGYERKHRYSVEKEDRYALLDEKFKIAIPYIFRDFPSYSTGKYFIEKVFDYDYKEKWIIIDRKGKIQLESDYNITPYVSCYNARNFSKFKDKDQKTNATISVSHIHTHLPDNWVRMERYDREKDYFEYTIYDVKRKKTIIPYHNNISSYNGSDNTFVIAKEIK